MGRPTKSGGRSSRDLPARDWIGGYRPRLRAAARPEAVWAGVEEAQPAPYLVPTLEEELLEITEAAPGEVAGVVFGYAGRDQADPYVVALRALPFPRVEPLEGGLRVPRQSWWQLSQRWQAELPELEPVGWFRIQPGRGTTLGSYDRFTAHQRFSDPLQFTWVLDPERGRQALYHWKGGELVPVPGYWRCSEPPPIPPREEARRTRTVPVARRAGVAAAFMAFKPWLLVAAAAAAAYLVLPWGSIASWIRPEASTSPETPPALETTLPLESWAGPGGDGPRSVEPFLLELPAGPDEAGGAGERSGELSPAGSEETGGNLLPGADPSETGAADAPGPAAYITYQVRQGDTLWRISLRLLGDPTRYWEIAELNGIRDPHLLEVGQVLRIPTEMGGAFK